MQQRQIFKNMIWVFKTSVKNKKQIKKLSAELDNYISPTGDWSFDLEDCDKILRIDHDNLSKPALINMMNKQGFLCEELPD
jgi:hypothetical protein